MRSHIYMILSMPLVLVIPSCFDPAPDGGGDTTGPTSDSGQSASSTVSAEATTGADTHETNDVSDEASATSTASDTTGVGPSCGDGVVEASEDCDGPELGGATCQSLGFEVGTLACNGCIYDTIDCHDLPGVPLLALGFSPVKQFDFSWAAVAGADYYQLQQSASVGEPYVQIGGDIVGESISLEMPLHLRHDASYVLLACNEGGCTESAPVGVVGSLAEAVGYVKASNTGASDQFGISVALSNDGNTLAVGAFAEDSSNPGNPGDNDANESGAVYVFVQDGMGTWSQQAYLKAAVPGAADRFGWSVALSGDGSTLAVGAYYEDSNALGIDGNPFDDSTVDSGAAYVFVRDGGGMWSQDAYIKASDTDLGDCFGQSVALSGDGDTLAVGAPNEDSNATGINGNQGNATTNSGAVYVFVRNGIGTWSQQAYVKTSNTGGGDNLGISVALSEDGNTLAAGARLEDSDAIGVDGNQLDNTAVDSGAVYVFLRDGLDEWSQEVYLKASNTDSNDYFGYSVALSGDGSTLAVGAYGEDSSATEIGGDEGNDAASVAGAVYVFARNGMGAWAQQTYIKPSNTGNDIFGYSVAISDNGDMLAVGARYEDGNTTGINGNDANNAASNAGAAFVFVRDGGGVWSQETYIKASNTDTEDQFGHCVSLSGDGHMLAVGAILEDGISTGIGGNQANDALPSAGAVYLY